MNTRRDTVIGVAFSIGAAMAYGVTAVLVRVGTTGLAPPLVGATISLLAGTLVMAIIALRSHGNNLKGEKRSVGFFAMAGVVGGLGITAYYFAISLAPVVIVSPLISTSPLFALLGVRLFLGKLERITSGVVWGTVLVVVGAVLVAIGSGA